LPRLGAPAAISLLAGPLGERFCGGPDWLAGGGSDFALAAEALRYTTISYSELVRQTEQIVDESYGLASRLADWLEVYGSLDSTRIYGKIAGFRALPKLVAALRAHDAAIDRARQVENGKRAA
jgi:hypothetical protein